ncbi:beta-galactosidase-1-like protein 2 [Octopus vulgaris]|uniref:Beta-galactosidase n=1 Tax=Octopus vulgaris TaxID=6645 RepID=A0AA36AX86_OCTVU|nr:beta-galactosidase-1-like protein 2 [Octopus vulgaris]
MLVQLRRFRSLRMLKSFLLQSRVGQCLVIFGFALLLYLYWASKFKSLDNRKIQGEALSAPPAQSLTFEKQQFYLKGKKIRILAGSVHYFRIVPQYWMPVLKKLKACGLNTVVTYVPWNLHEPSPNHYVFYGMLDLMKFLIFAHSLDLYVILRPGPYICSEWDFGGLPSWLLRTHASLRSNSAPYMFAVERYFANLLPQVVDFQYFYGGPIIAFQLENEFGSFSNEVQHLENLRELFIKNGVHELLLISDGLSGIIRATIPGVLLTANFGGHQRGKDIFKVITDINPENPLMVMEFWSGWFDHWGNKYRELKPLETFKKTFQFILNQNASFNFYMFMGGTNFGFMAGANGQKEKYAPDVTSYDYGALLSESGDITEKYLTAQRMIYEQVLKPEGISHSPQILSDNPKAKYGALTVSSYLSFKDMLDIVSELQLSSFETKMEFMELLNMNFNAGQSYGYILYEKSLPKVKTLKIGGSVADRAHILLNHQVMFTVNWTVSNPQFSLPDNDGIKLGILVENLGRVNYLMFDDKHSFSNQFKGLDGEVYLDGKLEEYWNIYPLDFSSEFLDKVAESDNWKDVIPEVHSPAMYKITFTLSSHPADTFLNLDGWVKGIVIVNGFNLGRYWNIGPQKTLYLPAPLLEIGLNVIYIFEEEQGEKYIMSVDQPDLGKISSGDKN